MISTQFQANVVIPQFGGKRKEKKKAVEKAFHNCGFHKTLMRLTKDYAGSTFIGGMKVTRGIVKC